MLASSPPSHLPSLSGGAVRALLAAVVPVALVCLCAPAALAAPTAAFHRDPPLSVVLLTGQSATFTSDSTPGSSLSWEVDGVPFGTQRSITVAFSDPGFHTVSLTATLNGESNSKARSFGVNSPLYPLPLQPPGQPPPSLMSPFPTVRLVGAVVRRGARIGLLEVVGAPQVARVIVRCRGRGCPFAVRRRTATTGRVRFRRFPHVLRAGARLQIFVRAPGVIGKYTGFRIRAGKSPVRTDRCRPPGASTKPTRCT